MYRPLLCAFALYGIPCADSAGIATVLNSAISAMWTCGLGAHVDLEPMWTSFGYGSDMSTDELQVHMLDAALCEPGCVPVLQAS